MLERIALWLALLLTPAFAIGSFAIFQINGSGTTSLAFGVNTQGIPGVALMALNRFNEARFPQTATTPGGGASTGEEQNLLLDANLNVITLAVGQNGSALTATQANVYPNNFGSGNYPGGANSYQFLWTGTGTFTFHADVTASHSTCGTNCFSLDVSPASGMEVDITSTGVNSTVSFSGSTVTWTASNFSNGTPIACQAAGATLPTQITQNNVYYVVNASTNTLGMATTVGGSAINFTGQSGTPKCYADWARNLILVQTAYVALAQSGEYWYPPYVAFLKNFARIRNAQVGNVYSNFESTGSATFSGTTVTIVSNAQFPNGLRAGQTILYNTTGTLPSPLVENQPYYVLAASLAHTTMQIATTAGGTPITFAGGSGTFNYVTGAVMTASDRTPANALYWGGTLQGLTTVWTAEGPPAEAMVALCNEAHIDCYLNIPHLAGTDYANAVAAIYHSGLNSKLRVYLEESNEIFLQGCNTTSGWVNVCSSNGTLAVRLFPLAGGINSPAYEYGVYKGIRDMAVWTSVWGADASRVVRVQTGQAGQSCSYSQFVSDMSASVDGGSTPTTVTISNATPALFTVASLPSYAVAGTPVKFTTTGSLNTGLTASTWAATFDCTGHSGSDFDYYITNDGSLTSTTFHVSDTKAHALAGTNTIATSSAGSGTQTVYFLYWDNLAYSHFDRFALAPYMPDSGQHLPAAWTADGDAGIGKFYTEYSAGGLLNTSATASHTTAGSTTAYTVTSGQGLTCPPPNQAIVNVKFNAGTITAATLDADTCNTHPPIQDRAGNAMGPGNALGFTGLATNQVQSFVYTSATSVGAVGTPGWRLQDYGYTGAGGNGFMHNAIDNLAFSCTNWAVPRGMPLMTYESGQQMSNFPNTDPALVNYLIATNQSTQMGTLYTTYYNLFPTTCVQEPIHYADVSIYGYTGAWGLLEYINEGTSPKFGAMVNLNATLPCWWTACQRQNFLLRRDLDPASNDNSPVGLAKTG